MVRDTADSPALRLMFDPADDDRRPIAAAILTCLGAVLIIFHAVLLLTAASLAFEVGYFSASGLLNTLGTLGLLFGLVLLALAYGLYTHPESHVGYGTTVVVMSLLSILGGGGFILGLILGVVGGILAIVFDAENDPLPEAYRVRGSDAPSFCRNCGAVLTASATVCSLCRSPVVSPRTNLAQERHASGNSGGTVTYARRGQSVDTTGPPNDPSVRPLVGCPTCGAVQSSSLTICKTCRAPLSGGPTAPDRTVSPSGPR